MGGLLTTLGTPANYVNAPVEFLEINASSSFRAGLPLSD